MASLPLNSPERHIGGLFLGEDALQALSREGATVQCVAGVPAGAVFLSIHYDSARRGIVLHFEHPSYPVHIPGGPVKMHLLAYEVIEQPDV